MSNHVIQRFVEIVRQHGDRPATRIREGESWRTQTYSQFDQKVRRVAQGLIDVGLQAGDRVALFTPNCPEWSEIDFGTGMSRGVLVPLYATSTPAQIAHIVSDSGARLMFVGGKSEAERVIEAREIAEMPQIITIEDYEGRPDDVILYSEFQKEPREAVEDRFATAVGEDLSAIVYTSGTTGSPKGAMLQHSALTAQCDALDVFLDVKPEDSSLAFLPLSHALERAWTTVVLTHGCLNTYVKNPRTVAEQMQLAQASMMVSVPKLFETVFATAHQKVASSPAKRAVFSWALKIGRHNQYSYRSGRQPSPLLRAKRALADKLVYSSVREAMGGTKNILACGGAPIRPEVEEFFSAVGMPILCGYGLTEASPLVTFNAPTDFKIGTVGRVMSGGELRVAEHGELLYRGPNVMKGYWNDEEATREAIDEDGWLHTGDVGYIDTDGMVTITDRLKDIIVTLGGKNVAPQPIEGLILSDPLFEHAVLIGDMRPFVTVLVKPSMAGVQELAEKFDWPGKAEDWLNSSELAAEIKARVEKLTEKLPTQDRPKEAEIVDEDFSMDNGLLTPTLKVRRREVEKRFKARIDAMYERMEKLRRG